MNNKELEKVRVINKDKLSEEQEKQFDRVLKDATQNKFLGDDEEDVIRTGQRRMVILFDDEVIGFYSPQTTSVKGVRHHRAGALFLVAKMRGKGIMEYVLREFFTTHSPGFSWIDDSNSGSIALFKRLGFKQSKAKEHDGHRGHFYLKDSSISLEHEIMVPAWASWAMRS